MSVTEEVYRNRLKESLAPLTLQQKTHTVFRLYEKLRLIHNAVGDVFQHRATIQEFQDKYPNVYDKVKGELAPYADNGYITEEGWMYFLNEMFEPRYTVVGNFIGQIRQVINATSAAYELEAL